MRGYRGIKESGIRERKWFIKGKKIVVQESINGEITVRRTLNDIAKGDNKQLKNP